MTLMFLRISQTAFLALALTSLVHAQQIASRDLLRPSAIETTPTQSEPELQQVNGCKKLTVGGYVDGVTLDKDNMPRKLRVELIEINTEKLMIGSEIVATVKLGNVGDKPVRIPWSTDFQTTVNRQDPYNRSWETAEFRMSIRDQKNPKYYDRLVTTSKPLYASQFAPDSYLTVEPAQWVTARISFLVAVQYPAFEKLSVGTNTLAMEWFQTVETRVVKGCGVILGHFPYDDPFWSVNRREVAQVQIEGRSPGTKPTE